jgi:protein disulfide-isomerase
MDKALEKAKAEKKNALVNITGSDRCSFCIKLDKEVFQSADFQKYAEKNLVLVKADFPRTKELSAEQKKANEEVKEKYAADFKGFPTVVLIDSSGKKLGENVGYGGGGPKPYIDELTAMAKK